MSEKRDVFDAEGPQPAELNAELGEGSPHEGEHYQVNLCEPCYFFALSTRKRQRMVTTMFDQDTPGEDFGRSP